LNKNPIAECSWDRVIVKDSRTMDVYLNNVDDVGVKDWVKVLGMVSILLGNADNDTVCVNLPKPDVKESRLEDRTMLRVSIIVPVYSGIFNDERVKVCDKVFVNDLKPDDRDDNDRDWGNVEK
jgi:hypothetical protein